jgi:predicted HTH domain antitoxin
LKRTNIMLDERQHKTLKAYARQQGRTLGHLVREAVDQAYQKKDVLEERRDVAVRAYKEGLISLGKVAEVLGLDPISARQYLKAKGIKLQVQGFGDVSRDALNA